MCCPVATGNASFFSVLLALLSGAYNFVQEELFIIIIIIIYQLWLISHPRGTVVLLDTGTPGTSREIYSEGVDDTDPVYFSDEKSTTVEK